MPCWCGSGRKYKKCHLGRAEEPSVPHWEISKHLRKHFSRKYCSVPETLRRNCSGRIVQAHTVSRASSLKRIAREGHVYKVMPTIYTLVQNSGRPEPKLIGINDASTFTGFCAYHDRELFSPIENQPFAGKSEQIFLLAYRAICREWYNKRAATENIPFLQKLDSGLSLPQQAAIQDFVSAYAEGTAAGLRNSEFYKSTFDKMLHSHDYSQMRFCHLVFDKPPAVMGSGGLFPEVDFSGNPLQDLSNVVATPDVVLFSSFSSEGRGHFCFIWHRDYDETPKRLVDSFTSIPDELKPDALLRFMFEFCENLYLEPTWWESRSTAEANAIISRIRQGSPFIARQQLCLTDDGFRMADWKIESVYSG